MEDKISVLMSVYNSENSVSYSIESLLNQTYKNLEILLIDDGSTDLSYEVCKSYLSDNRVKLIKNEKNIGLTRSLNILAKQSTGAFLARQDADDVSDSIRLEKQMQKIVKKNADACTTRAYSENPFRLIPKYSSYVPKKMIFKFKNPFIHGTLLIKKETFFNIGMYDESFYYAQDYKLFVELYKMKKKIIYINEPLYKLNLENNISTNFLEQQNYFAKCARKQIKPKKYSVN